MERISSAISTLSMILLTALAFLAVASPAALADDATSTPNTETQKQRADTADEAGEVWGCPMCETIRQDRPGTCPICKMDLVRMDTDADAGPAPAEELESLDLEGGGFFDAEELSRETEDMSRVDTEPRALMPGLPDWLFYAASVFMLVLSFVLFEVWGRRRSKALQRSGAYPTWDLFKIPGLKRLVRARWFQLSLQIPVVLIFALIIFAGFFGNPYADRNIAPVLTWTIWWTWLAFLIIFFGKAWCTACPWMGIADWIRRIIPDRWQLNLGWPRRLRNIWVATALFVFLTWLELGYGVTDRPMLTASLGVGMLVISLATVLVFERKAFCRYACLVGRVSGLYAMFSTSELRATDRDICRNCATKDCFKGNDRGLPCPTHQFMGAMDVNTYCIMCSECVKTCPHDNISWRARPPGADLLSMKKTSVDEAYLAVIMLSMSAFHGLTMVPMWDEIVAWIRDVTHTGWLISFTLGMAAMLAAPLLLYFAVCALMKWAARDRENGVRRLFIKFAYSLLPIALFYHLAHNLQHIFYEGKKLIRIASDPFGWGWDLFGTAKMPIDAVLPADVGWSIQVALILIGHIYGIYIAHKIAFDLYDDPRQATLSQIPMLVVMALFSFQSLWLIAQPMVMRTAM